MNRPILPALQPGVARSPRVADFLSLDTVNFINFARNWGRKLNETAGHSGRRNRVSTLSSRPAVN